MPAAGILSCQTCYKLFVKRRQRLETEMLHSTSADSFDKVQATAKSGFKCLQVNIFQSSEAVASQDQGYI